MEYDRIAYNLTILLLHEYFSCKKKKKKDQIARLNITPTVLR